MKKNYFFLTIISISFLISGCMHQHETHEETHEIVPTNEYLLAATLYHQKAAEMQALSYQAYNIAKLRVDEKLIEAEDVSKLAIVLDIDETVLDNSPYEAKSILDNTSYPNGWDEWMNHANADALPGAVEFLKYADDHGFQIFYVTNRKEIYREQTMKNLIDKGFPQSVDDHLLLRTDESSKEKRRNAVSENHEIFMLLGDNLADFDMVFDKKSSAERFFGVEKLHREFGKKFIILPNAMYGDWMSAIIDYDNKLDQQQKIEKYKQSLKGF
jgi:5'-nucleotidase (lipoprotein e(P4) family)